DPASPVWGPAVARQAGVVHDAGTAGLTRLADGQAMVMIFGDDAEEYEVFSAPADGRALTEATWTSRASGDSPAGFEAYQNLQLITRCDGALMVLGTHKTLLGDDWADLWRVELDPDTLAPTFTKVAKRNLTCRSASTGDTRYCDFQAGAGGFIGAGGRLYIYGVEHYDDAFPGDGEGVKVREFPPT
ncbi:MAG: hypothetical protein KC486_07515, partial [Myxococcales bacterium]|nr:hypothetical protein [Myxococcales bacterium]